MQLAKIIQAVILLTIVAMAASCAATKEYAAKIFPQKQLMPKDSQALALHFLDLDKAEPDQKDKDWVSTDIIMGRDTTGNTIALDNLAKIYPPKEIKKDSIVKKTPLPDSKEIIAKNEKKVALPDETNKQPVKVIDGVREKTTRDD
ncbi:MAG TPA: hypothetical protein PKW62_08055 [Chitinophagaceae bacterium]|nr:hypothetical protein [Chitinophagaceae bacterium]